MRRLYNAQLSRAHLTVSNSLRGGANQWRLYVPGNWGEARVESKLLHQDRASFEHGVLTSQV